MSEQGKVDIITVHEAEPEYRVNVVGWADYRTDYVIEATLNRVCAVCGCLLRTVKRRSNWSHDIEHGTGCEGNESDIHVRVTSADITDESPDGGKVVVVSVYVEVECLFCQNMRDFHHHIYF